MTSSQVRRACPACGAAPEAGQAFCAACGAALRAPGVSPARTTPLSGRGAWDLARSSARRLWPMLALLSLLGYYDYKVNGQLAFDILVGGGVAGAMLFWPRLRPRLAGVLEVFEPIPPRFRGPLLAGVPAAVFYLARLKGTQSGGAAFLTMLAILGFGLVVASYRSQIDRRLGPFFEQRDRLLPRPVRIGLVFAIPVVLTFLVAHQDLGDIGAFFGGDTASPRSPAQGNSGLLVALTALLSAAAVFLLLNERSSGESP